MDTGVGGRYFRASYSIGICCFEIKMLQEIRRKPEKQNLTNIKKILGSYQMNGGSKLLCSSLNFAGSSIGFPHG